jgi:hypothetical protein
LVGGACGMTSLSNWLSNYTVRVRLKISLEGFQCLTFCESFQIGLLIESDLNSTASSDSTE